MPKKEDPDKRATGFFQNLSFFYGISEFLRVFKILLFGIGFTMTFGVAGVVYSIVVMTFLFLWFNVISMQSRILKLFGNFAVIMIALLLWRAGAYYSIPLIIIIFELFDVLADFLYYETMRRQFNKPPAAPSQPVIMFSWEDIARAAGKKLSDKKMWEAIDRVNKEKRKYAKKLVKG